MEFIELRDIYKTYNLGEIDVPVLKGISLTVAHGEFVALMQAQTSFIETQARLQIER